MRTLLSLSTMGVIAMITGCRPAGQPPGAVESGTVSSIWAVDLVRTLPGAQTEYLRNIETNWSNARRLARAGGAVRSYRALVAPPDSARGWDVMLMTEYSDSAAYLNREAIFESIFASPEYVRVDMSRPSAELRVLAASTVPMRVLVSQPSR